MQTFIMWKILGWLFSVTYLSTVSSKQTVILALCGFLASSRIPTQLYDIMAGLVVGRYGQTSALSKPHGNVFFVWTRFPICWHFFADASSCQPEAIISTRGTHWTLHFAERLDTSWSHRNWLVKKLCYYLLENCIFIILA